MKIECLIRNTDNKCMRTRFCGECEEKLSFHPHEHDSFIRAVGVNAASLRMLVARRASTRGIELSLSADLLYAL